VSTKVERNYLEINSLKDLKKPKFSPDDCLIDLSDPTDFQINKFFYKQIGKKHRWIDRLVWEDNKWIKFVESPHVRTFILKDNNNMAGYYETIHDSVKNHSEIAYFGILQEYIGKKCGGFLLSEAILKLFDEGVERIWLHTCSLDHKNALKNYLSRGMKIFKSESINLDIS